MANPAVKLSSSTVTLTPTLKHEILFFKRAFAVVELEAHRFRCQSFEYPCLHEVVVDLKVTSWCSLCCRFRLAVKYCVNAHARTQQSSASGQTTWTRLNITENNGNVQSRNICLAKVFDRDQTSLNLSKQDTTRLNTSKQGGQTYSTLLH